MDKKTKSDATSASSGLLIKKQKHVRDDIALPSGVLGAGWAAHEIILVNWQLNRTADPAYATIDHQSSGVYSSLQLAQILATTQKDYLADIQNFAIDLSNEALPAPGQPLHSVTSNNPPAGDNDVVVWYKSYVVFALESGYPWRYMEGVGQPAMDTKADQNPPNTYSDLCHLVGANVYPAVGNGTSTIAYFSADSTPDFYSSTPFNLYVDYRPLTGIQYVQGYFDPAIKNDGHAGGGRGHPHGAKGSHKND